MPHDSIYDTYASSDFGAYTVPVADQASVAQYVANHWRHLPRASNAAILDIGCGAGHYLHWLQQLGYTAVRGVDVSAAAVAHCQAYGLPALQVDDLGVFLDDHRAAYDCITLNDVIEHLDREVLVGTLSSARAALRPGGALLVKTLNMASIGAVHLRYADFTHTGGFTEKSLRQVFTAAGFARVSVYPYALPPGGPKRLLYRAARRLWELAMNLVFVVELGTDRPAVRTKLMLAVAYA